MRMIAQQMRSGWLSRSRRTPLGLGPSSPRHETMAPSSSPPLPLSFVLLPTSLLSPRLTPFLTVTLNGVTVYRTLDPEPREVSSLAPPSSVAPTTRLTQTLQPFVSSSLLLLSQGLPPLAALTRYGCQLPLGYGQSHRDRLAQSLHASSHCTQTRLCLVSLRSPRSGFPS